MIRAAAALLLLTAAAPPKGLPDAPEWRADPDNPNQPMPPRQAGTPEKFDAPDPQRVRDQIEQDAQKGTKSADPASRFAEAFKPQTRRIRPGQISSVTAANDGDTILLAPGTYRECAVFAGSNITIKSEQPGKAVFDGVTCENKAIFVLRGNRVTIDGIVFRNASVRDRNGAGIRLEGNGLTIRRSQFHDNENGLLVGVSSKGSIVIEDSLFDGNGSCEGSGCAHGIYVNQVDQLTVRRSTFINTRFGHHVKSRAKSTLVEDCVIDDNRSGHSSYLIDAPNGGVLTVRNNLLIKGPKTDNESAFITFGVEGMKHTSPPPRIEGNRFISRLGVPTFLLMRAANAPAPVMTGNSSSGKIAGAVLVAK